jgi:hypothetical protein
LVGDVIFTACNFESGDDGTKESFGDCCWANTVLVDVTARINSHASQIIITSNLYLANPVMSVYDNASQYFERV